MIIRVITGTLSLVVGSPPHRKTTRLYAGDVIQLDEGQHLEIIADVSSTAEFRPGTQHLTRMARPRPLEAYDETHSEAPPPS